MEEPDLEQVRAMAAARYQDGGSAGGGGRDPLEVDDPQPYFAEKLERGRVMARNGSVTFLHHRDGVEFMRNKAVRQPGSGLLMGSPRPLIPLDLDGPLHRKYRKLLDPLFAPRQVNPLEPRIRALANELIDDFVDAGEVELYEAFCVPLPTRIFVDMMGLPESDRPRFIDWKDRTIKPEPGEPQEVLAGIQAAGIEMSDYIAEVVDERAARSEPGDDLISRLLHAELDGERLTKQQLCDIVYLLMIAGLDTVTSTMSLMFAQLASRPDLRISLVQRPELINNAVEELMRYDAAVAGSNRLVIEDTEVAGVAIEAGSYVQVSWQACNIDPEVFDNPLEIDFERENIHHTSFAAGPHRCMGSHLARMELRIALDEFHKRVPDYAISPGAKPEYTYGGVRAASTLPITFPPTGR